MLKGLSKDELEKLSLFISEQYVWDTKHIIDKYKINLDYIEIENILEKLLVAINNEIGEVN
ncbi:MAG: hypothetical protein HUJ88_11475 [Fusobacterium necrophorum]|nr:hypothetical protein [Fusobacterium necrophorum]